MARGTEDTFPGYLFVITGELEKFCMASKNVAESAKFIGTGSEIVPLAVEEVLMMRKLVNKDGMVEFSYGVIHGGEILITIGPLKGLEGCIRRINRLIRAADLGLELMGQPVKVQVGLEIVEKG